MIIMLSLDVCLAARYLLDTPAAPPPALGLPTIPSLPKATLPPLPSVPTLPTTTLPPLPTLPTQPTLPKSTLPPLPSTQVPTLPTMPTVPKVTLPPLPATPLPTIPTTIPSIPNIPTTIPTIPFFSPPPSNWSTSPWDAAFPFFHLAWFGWFFALLLVLFFEHIGTYLGSLCECFTFFLFQHHLFLVLLYLWLWIRFLTLLVASSSLWWLHKQLKYKKKPSTAEKKTSIVCKTFRIHRNSNPCNYSNAKYKINSTTMTIGHSYII